MRNKINKALFLQVFILLICLIALTNTYSEVFVKAQTNCSAGPLFFGEVAGNGLTGDEITYSWEENSNVTVKIDDQWNKLERNQIKDGIEKWNGTVSQQTCSNVTFSDFGAQTFTDKDALPPYPGPRTIYVTKHPTRPTATLQNGVRGNPARMYVGLLRIGPNATFNQLKVWATHEIGHSFALANCGSCGSTSIMSDGPATSEITACDIEKIGKIYCPTPTPTPTPSCPDPPPTYRCDFEVPQTECPYNEDTRYCDVSPILIDVSGDGFNLTNAANGVLFDINNHGDLAQVAWTAAGTDDAWLALDRNGNGLIDDGKELFGDVAAQPSPPAGEQRNGFLALAEFDKAKNGGNSDSVIDNKDAVFSRLRLWRDTNHNGVSESSEMHALVDFDVAKINLKYKESKHTDEFGNRFRYRAKVSDARGAQVGRWAWDVFLVKE